MKAMGIRCTAKEVLYVVMEGPAAIPTIVDHDKLKIPKAYETPRALAWLRNHVVAVLEEYSIVSVFIKTIEPISGQRGTRGGTYMRCYFEGVSMEAVASKGIPLRTGAYTTISSLLSTKSAKKYVGQDSFRSIRQWDTLNRDYQDAALAAVAALRFAEEACNADSNPNTV